jgi:uncharacterized ferritin-like protein (DUF455 family)
MFSAPRMPMESSLVGYALAVLNTPRACDKVALTRQAVECWNSGDLPAWVDTDADAPPMPARDPAIVVCHPGEAPKRGRGGTLASRVALVHSLAHIESWAVDLSWDIIARFGRQCSMPRDFYDDWAQVALEEARHHELLAKRLTELGSFYGELPCHDGLWQSASETMHSLAARLAVEHATHEARGLDILPQTIARFRAGGDDTTAKLLESVILPEEISHCGKGVRWFTWMACRDTGGALSEEHVAALFHAEVKLHFRGTLKPPFNVAARQQAGFPLSWYALRVADQEELQMNGTEIHEEMDE